MTPAEAEDLAARIIAAIDAWGWARDLRVTNEPQWPYVAAADRERVASDLAGLRDHQQIANLDPGHNLCERCMTSGHTPDLWPCADARRYADGLRRTSNLYGVTP